MALTCLLLAAKYDELDDKIPFINDLARLVKNVVTVRHADMIRMETKLLFAFGFDLMIITPIHFVYSISAQGFIFEGVDQVLPKSIRNHKSQKETLAKQEKKQVTKKLSQNARKYAEFFADLST